MNETSRTFTGILARLRRIFGASGASHSSGLVPDPGSSSGTTKYLREDATWQVPPGGSGTDEEAQVMAFYGL